MRKIANTTELQTELRNILAYTQSELPSRERIASELQSLSERLAADSPARALSKFVKGDLKEAFEALYNGATKVVADLRRMNESSDVTHAMKAAEELKSLVRGEVDRKFEKLRGIVEGDAMDAERG